MQTRKSQVSKLKGLKLGSHSPEIGLREEGGGENPGEEEVLANNNLICSQMRREDIKDSHYESFQVSSVNPWAETERELLLTNINMK